MKNNLILNIIFFFFFPFFVFGQQDVVKQELFMSEIPPAPNSSSLGEYIEIPVNTYTGIPNINIPLFNIITRDFEMPVSLQYHPSGIKVSQVASWVGLGWILNAGGVITRTVRGVPDDRDYESDAYNSKGILTSNLAYNVLSDGQPDNNNGKSLFCTSVQSGEYDCEPDLFYYNFIGKSGKFVFDINKEINLIPRDQLIIKPYFDNVNRLVSFEIRDDKGILYIFNECEETSNNLPRNRPFNSSWYLHEIISPNDHIVLTYSDEESLEKLIESEMHYIKSDGTTGNLNKYPITPILRYKTKRLTKIQWSNGYMNFVADHRRIDIGHHDEDTKYNKALTEIEIYDIKENLIKQFSFNYSYFDCEECDLDPSDIYLGKRLKLNSVCEKSNAIIKPPYIFKYDETPLPARNSVEQDFWGYYNGNLANTLIPNLYAYPDDEHNQIYLSPYSIFKRHNFTGTEFELFVGADRSTKPEKIQAGVLKKVQYPTGGIIEYIYQCNDFNLDGENRLGGGLRIEKIISKPINGNVITKIFEYNYLDNPNISSGKIIYLPQFAFLRVNLGISITDLSSMLMKTQISTDNIGTFTNTQGSTIGYEEIIVYETGNGKIVNRYEIPAVYEDFQYDCEDDMCIYNRSTAQCSYGIYYCDESLMKDQPIFSPSLQNRDNYPFAPNPNYDWNRGKLSEQLFFSEADLNNPVKKIEYIYKIKDYNIIPATKVGYIGFTKNTKPFPCCLEQDCMFDIISYNHYKYAQYYYISGWNILEEKKSNFYDKNFANEICEREIYNYEGNNHMYLTKIEKYLSDNSTLKTKYIYPADFQFYNVDNPSLIIPPCSGASEMLNALYVKNNKNMINDPLETIKYKNDYVFEAKYNIFRIDNDKVLLDKTYKLAIDDPIHKDNFDLSNLEKTVGNVPGVPLPMTCVDKINFDDGYPENPEIVFDSYDNKGNLLQYHKTINTNTSYIWGYSQTYPMAVVKNAEHDEIFVENFDCTIDELIEKSWNNYNNWSGITTTEYEGRSCLQISGPEWLTVPIIGVKPGDKYIVTARVKKDINHVGIKAQIAGDELNARHLIENGEWCWLTFTCEIPEGYTGDPKFLVYITNYNDGTAYVDELRVFPADAQMTSYTYDPLVGMTSQTDANGLTTYYKYDDLGRLLETRDDDYNIVQAQEYHYKNETVTGGISVVTNDCYLKFECNVSGGSNSFSYLWEIVSDNHCDPDVSVNYLQTFGISMDANDDTCSFIFDVQCTVTDLVTGKEYIFTISSPYYCN